MDQKGVDAGYCITWIVLRHDGEVGGSTSTHALPAQNKCQMRTRFTPRARCDSVHAGAARLWSAFARFQRITKIVFIFLVDLVDLGD